MLDEGGRQRDAGAGESLPAGRHGAAGDAPAPGRGRGDPDRARKRRGCRVRLAVSRQQALGADDHVESGIGTAHAVAEAHVTRKEIEGWCANWSPDDKGCVARELASDAAKQTYRASADCTRGRITAVHGGTYTLDGV